MGLSMLNKSTNVLLFIKFVRLRLVGFLYLYYLSFISIYFSAVNAPWLGVNLSVCHVTSAGFPPKLAGFWRGCSGSQVNYTKVLSC